MIFLFDKFKKLKGTVRNRHTISLLYERERNGLYTVSAEIPLKITDKKTVYNYHKKVKDSDFLGHYDREGRFQLHKIASVDIEDSSIYIKGVHIFFDEAKAGAIIQERRFRDREIIDGARVAFDSIGWSVVDFDVSDTKDYIFYNVSPLEARAILVETFGFEFDYWLDFDGKNIRNKQISVKREMGIDSNKRYNYGHNVLNIKVEQDYSEIYTAVIGRGKGEDLGDDAYGRRIEYTDVEWKTPTNPMNKPKGSRTLHDENATQLFGYHEDGKVSPRTKVEIFEDIEEPEELLQASYEWLKENSVPKAVFSLKVPDGDGLDLGDKVHVIYRDIDLVKHTRVTKVVDDLVSGYRDVEFGDTAYFKTDRRLSGVKSELKRVGGSASSRITRLKDEFDRRFDNEVQQWKDDFEQAVIDAEAAVEVMRAEMEEEFDTVRTEMTDRFEAEKAAAYEEAQRNYDTIHDRITTEVDAARSDLESSIERNIAEAERIAQLEYEDIRGTITSSIDTTRTEIEKSITDSIAESERKAQLEYDEIEQRVTDKVDSTRTDLEKEFADSIAESERKAQSEHEDIESRITGTIDTTRTAMEQKITDSIAETERKAQIERDEIEQRITDKVDTTRDELELSFGTSVESARQYAEQQAQEKSDAVKGELETVTNGHQQMLDDLESNVMSIDDFIGDSRSITLDERFQDITTNFEERIQNVDSNTYNMLRGTQFDESDLFSMGNGAFLRTDEDDNYVRLPGDVTNTPFVRFEQNVTLETGKKYIIAFDYRTDSVKEMDGIYLERSNGTFFWLHNRNIDGPGVYNLKTDGNWSRTYISLESNESVSGRLRVGTNFSSNDTTIGNIDIKLIYVTRSNNIEWVYHPRDATQSISEVTRRVTNLEDGRSELITRFEYDFETGQLDQHIKSVEDTVEGNKTVLQRVEDWQATNGASIEETIYGFEQKVWLNDVANIGANLIPQSSNAWEEGGLWTESGNEAALSSHIRLKERLKIKPSTTYTVSSNSTYLSNIEAVNIHQYLYTGGWINHRSIPRNGEVTFTTWGTAGTIRISLTAREGFTVRKEWFDELDSRIKIKLEEGSTATPMLNAVSKLEQLANSVSIKVQEIDGEFIYQSDISVQPDYVQIGSQRIGGEDIGSFLRVSPTGIDMVAEAMRLSGDLYVDGDITALAVNAIEADFARLWAEEFSATTIDVEDISGRTAWFERLYTLNANIDKLTAQHAFINEVDALIGNFVELNAGNIVTSGLSADIITAEHVASKSLTVKEIVIDDAFVNTLVARTVFAEDITSKIGNFIDLNVGTIRSAILTADSVNATHIESESIGANQIRANSVLINKLFANSFAAEHITSTSLEAVEGEFGRLFASQVEANTISVDYISGRTAWFERLYTLNANIEKLTSQLVFTEAINAKVGNFIDLNVGSIRSSILTSNTITTDMLKSKVVTSEEIKVDDIFVNLITARTVFTDAVHAKSLDAVEANIGRVRTAFLEADVISGSHISSNTIEIKHLTGYDAMLETLMARTVFSNQVRSLSIQAVEADIGNIRSKILTSNVVKASHIESGTVLIDKIFSSTAMFERMMSKSAFVRTLNTVSIDTDQLTIRRADGGVLVSNGTQKFGSPIITKPFPSSSVTFDGVNYVTSSRGSQTFERAYGEHSGRWANFSFSIGLRYDSKDASALVGVVARRENYPTGGYFEHEYGEFMAYRDSGSRSYVMNVRMPVPTFGAVSWTLDFYVIGSQGNYAQIRTNRCWVSA